MSEDYLKKLRQHIMEFISPMKPGDETDCEGLIAPEVWKSVPAIERRYAFGKPVARLVAQGKVPLVLSNYDSKRHNVYRRI